MVAAASLRGQGDPLHVLLFPGPKGVFHAQLKHPLHRVVAGRGQCPVGTLDSHFLLQQTVLFRDHLSPEPFSLRLGEAEGPQLITYL